MGPGSNYILGGPIYWFMVVLLFLAGMLAAFVVIDSVRRAFFAHTAERTVRWWTYLVPQGAYLLLLLVVQGPWLPLIASAVMVLLTPLALIQSIAYLLRVVFPKTTLPAADVSAEPSIDVPTAPDAPTAPDLTTEDVSPEA